MLVIYVIVLLAHRSLGAFFELVLTVAGTDIRGQRQENATKCDLHVHETVIAQDSHQLVQFFGLKPHATSQIVIFETTIHNMSHTKLREKR